MFNTTQTIGLIVTAIAAAACFVTALPRPWRALAILHALAFIEILLEFRHHAHAFVNILLRSRHVYEHRQFIQIGLLALIAIIAIGVLIAIRRQARPAARIGLIASSALVLVFLAEAVSLHAIDAVLYHGIGGTVKFIALLWAIPCIITAVAAHTDQPTARKGRRR